MKRYKTLILNANFDPILIRPWEKGFSLIYKEKAFQLEKYDQLVYDGRRNAYEIPSVICLKEYIKRSNKATVNRTNILLRDRYTCCYCGYLFKEDYLTMDHVIPKSRWVNKGTFNRFDNLVTACEHCNFFKEDKLLSECNMKLIKSPKEINQQQLMRLKLELWNVPDSWRKYA